MREPLCGLDMQNFRGCLGHAEIPVDAELCRSFAVNGKPASLVLPITVQKAYYPKGLLSMPEGAGALQAEGNLRLHRARQFIQRRPDSAAFSAPQGQGVDGQACKSKH